MATINKNSTIQTHIVRINQAIHFIEQNLDKDLSLNVLAERAHYSPFHFHRIFSEIVLETPLEFVNRKRIEKIAWSLLKYREMSIRELCFRYGFDNPASFSKSFKKYYGINASSLRKKAKSVFNKIYRKNSKNGKFEVGVETYLQNVETIKEWMIQHASIESRYLPSQKMIAIRSRGRFDLSNIAFEKLRNWAQKKELLSFNNHQWILVIHDNPAITEISKLSHSACLKLQTGELDFQEEMDILTLSAGEYLIGTFEIGQDDFAKAWGGLSIWLMDYGYEYRDSDYFEVFHTDSLFQQSTKHLVDLCIPIV